MKKIMSLLLSILMIISLSACDNTSANDTASVENKEEVTEVKEETSSEVKEEEVKQENATSVSEGVSTYDVSGTLTETLVIESSDDVVINLNNVNAKLEDNVINIKSAKSATIIISGDNVLESTATDKNTIKSDVDLTIKGDGILTIASGDTCIKSDTNLIIESGTYNLTGSSEGDGLRSNETLTINGGTFTINAGEAIESTQITINGGSINANASDDGINASAKSTTLSPCFTMNDGELYVTMAQGDTDAIDSNGDLVINGGYININAVSPFDYDGQVVYNGGTIVVNGQEVNSITNQFGGGMGGMPGQGGQAPSGGFPGGQGPSAGFNGGQGHTGGFRR